MAICGGFDPFGAGSISPECLDYIQIDASNHASVDQTIAEVSLTGPLFALPAGDLKAAFGVFYKEDKYEYTASPEASVFLPDGRPDIQGFLASKDIKGDDHNFDIYAELLLPLLRDMPGAESLEAVAWLPVVGLRLGRKLRFLEGGADLPARRRTSRARLVPAGCSGSERLRALSAAAASE